MSWSGLPPGVSPPALFVAMSQTSCGIGIRMKGPPVCVRIDGRSEDARPRERAARRREGDLDGVGVARGAIGRAPHEERRDHAARPHGPVVRVEKAEARGGGADGRRLKRAQRRRAGHGGAEALATDAAHASPRAQLADGRGDLPLLGRGSRVGAVLARRELDEDLAAHALRAERRDDVDETAGGARGRQDARARGAGRDRGDVAAVDAPADGRGSAVVRRLEGHRRRRLAGVDGDRLERGGLHVEAGRVRRTVAEGEDVRSAVARSTSRGGRVVPSVAAIGIERRAVAVRAAAPGGERDNDCEKARPNRSSHAAMVQQRYLRVPSRMRRWRAVSESKGDGP